MATTISTTPPSTSTFSHDSIVNAVIIVISEECNHPVTLDSRLADDLDLDSLDFVNVAQQLEERLGLGPIPDSDLFKLVTVEQVVLYCEAWLKQKSEVAAASAHE
jgi:acyl carrier protein